MILINPPKKLTCLQKGPFQNRNFIWTNHWNFQWETKHVSFGEEKKTFFWAGKCSTTNYHPTWQCKNNHLKMYFILKLLIFQLAMLAFGRVKNSKKRSTTHHPPSPAQTPRWCEFETFGWPRNALNLGNSHSGLRESKGQKSYPGFLRP